MSIRKAVESIAPKFAAYSESRMPYTFHHDFMRSRFPDKYGSRADVAKAFIDADDDHLYSIAFLYLMSNTDGVEVIENLSYDDFVSAGSIIFEAKRNLEML